MTKISVALCTFNGEKHLREQLESIARQSRRPDELIVNDDQSTDRTMSMLQEFAAIAPFPVSIERNIHRLGAVQNFGAALARCSGKLIALCDQDDIWLPDKLTLLAAYLERQPSVRGVFTDAYVKGDNDKGPDAQSRRLWDVFCLSDRQRRDLKKGHAIDVLADRYVVTGATMMLRREVLADALPIPEHRPSELWHDGWIALICACTGGLAAINQPTIVYRLHGAQQAGVPAPRSRWQRFRQAMADGRATLDEELTSRLKERELTAALLRERLGPEKGRSDLFDAKIRHLQRRLSLPRSRLARARIVGREFIGGDYHRFAQRPWAVAARDIVLPVR